MMRRADGLIREGPTPVRPLLGVPRRGAYDVPSLGVSLTIRAARAADPLLFPLFPPVRDRGRLVRGMGARLARWTQRAGCGWYILRDMLIRMENNIRALRTARSWSIAELAHRANLAAPNLNNVELGKANPKLDTLAAIARALGVGVGDLFARKASRRTAASLVRPRRALKRRRRPMDGASRRVVGVDAPVPPVESSGSVNGGVR